MARAAKGSPARRPPRPAATKKAVAAPSKDTGRLPVSKQQQKIDTRFQAIFGGQFGGHHQYVQKKLLRLKQQLQLQDSKRPTGALLEDFHEIDAYRCITNLRVCEAIRRGVFQQVETLDQLPNLVEQEEKEFFHKQALDAKRKNKLLKVAISRMQAEGETKGPQMML